MNECHLPLNEEDISKFSSQKWNEKCERVNELNSFLSANREFDFDQNILTIFVHQYLNDVNINVNSSIVNFLITLTPILQNDERYKTLLSTSLLLIINKYKEKKDKLNDEVNTLLTIILKNTLDMKEFLTAIKDFVNDKSIVLKSSVAEFIFVNLRKSYLSQLLGETLNVIIEIFSTLIKDNNLDVKNCALSCLALVRKRVGKINFDECEMTSKLSNETKYEIECVKNNVNYNENYDDVEVEDVEEIEEEVEEEEEESDHHQKGRRTYRESSRLSEKNSQRNSVRHSLKGSSTARGRSTGEKKIAVNKSNTIDVNDFATEKNQIHFRSNTIDQQLLSNYNTENLSKFVQSKRSTLPPPKSEDTIKVNVKNEPAKEETPVIPEVKSPQKIEINRANPENPFKSNKLQEEPVPVVEEKNEIKVTKEPETVKSSEGQLPKPKIVVRISNKVKSKEVGEDSSELQKSENTSVPSTQSIVQSISQSPKNPPNQEVQSPPTSLDPSQSVALEDFEKKLALALKEEESKPSQQPDPIPQKSQKKKTEEDIEYCSRALALTSNQSIIDLFDTTKWDDKKKGLTILNEFIMKEKTQIAGNKAHQDTVFNFIRIKINNFKETNFNILKEAYACYNSLFGSPLDKSFMTTLIKGIYEKIADMKLKESINLLMNTLIETYGPTLVTGQLLGLLDKKAKLHVMKEYCSFFEKVIDDYGVDVIDLKSLISFAVIVANNSNPQARTCATSLLCSIYKYMGDEIKPLIKDIKESTLKVIEGEMGKVAMVDKSAIKPKKVVANVETPQNINKDLIPRADISKLITANLIGSINNGKWGERKEAIEAIMKIIQNANNKILPNGLKDLMNMIKSKLADGNKNLVKLILQLLTMLIVALGSGLKSFTKTLGVPLLSTLADKSSQLREEAQNCIEKWIKNYNYESLIVFVPPLLKNENFEMRSELMTILIKNKGTVLSESMYKELINPLLISLQDKTTIIRNQVEEMIVSTFKHISVKHYYYALTSFKPAIANTLKSIIDRLCEENSIKVDAEEIVSNGKVIAKKVTPTSLGPKKLVSKTPTRVPAKKTPSNSTMKKEKTNTQIKAKRAKDKENLLGSCSVILNHKMNIYNSKPVQITHSIFLNNYKPKPNAKEKRIENDRKTKFGIESTSYEYGPKLKDHFKYIFSTEMIKNLCEDDPKKTTLAITSISSALAEPNMVNNVIENLDLILKQIAYKFSRNQNPSLVKSFYELASAIVKTYTENENMAISDTEANVLFNLLAEKLTSPNNIFKNNSNSLIREITQIYGKEKSFIMLMNIALSRTGRVRTELIDIINSVYSSGEVKEDTLAKVVKPAMRIYNTPDHNLRAKFVGIIKEIYNVVGEEIWRYCELNDREKKDLYEKIGLEEENEEYEEYEEEEEVEEENENEGENKSILSKDTKIKISNIKTSSNAKNGNLQTAALTNNAPKSLTPTKDSKPGKSNEGVNKSTPISNSKSGENKVKKENQPTKNGPKPAEGPTSPQLARKQSTLTQELLEKTLSSLNNPRMNIIESILAINDTVYKHFDLNQDLLKANVDLIFSTFITSLTNFFSISPLQVKVTKYITNVLCKISTIQQLISLISFSVLSKLIHLVLTSVLYDNLSNLGENKEGMIIWKSFNSIMLRILEFCDRTDVIKLLIEKEKLNRVPNPRLSEYSARCIIKLTHSINESIADVRIDEVLRSMHELLIDFEKEQPDLQIKSQTDHFVILSLKNLLIEMTKLKKEAIIEDYIKGVETHEIHDKYIKRWIKNTLDSLGREEDEKANYNTVNTVGNTGKSKTIDLDDEEDKKEPKEQGRNEKKNNIAEKYHTIHHEEFDALKLKLSSLNISSLNKKKNQLGSRTERIDRSRDEHKTFGQIQKKWKDVLGRTQHKKK